MENYPVKAAKPLQLRDGLQQPKEKASVDLETHYPQPGPQKWKCLSQICVDKSLLQRSGRLSLPVCSPDHSPVCANTWDKATGVSAEVHLLVQEEINLILPQITTSCPVIARVLLSSTCSVSQLWLEARQAASGGAHAQTSPRAFGLEGPCRGIQTFACLLQGDLGC